MIKKVYLDANLLIAHQAKGHTHHTQAKEFVEKLWRQRTLLYLSDLTIDEFLYGISFILRGKNNRSPYSSFYPKLKDLINDILSWQNIKLVSFRNNYESLSTVLEAGEKYNLRPRDAFHLQIMQQQQVNKLATFDSDFQKAARQDAIEVLN